jgi:NADH-quinone oxidoreductase subunit N
MGGWIMNPGGINITPLTPEILLLVLACGILIADFFLKIERKRHLWDAALIGLFIVLITIVHPSISSKWMSIGTILNGEAFSDPLTMLTRLIIVTVLFTALVFSIDCVSRTPQKIGIYLFLTIMSAFGGLVMSSAGDLLVLLIGLEILSIPLYVLAGFDRRKEEGRQASFKYFILGTFASAILMFGIMLVFASMKSISLSDGIVRDFSGNTMLKIGAALVISALAFKGGLMPFYAWIPDVYRGSPDYVVGFMAAVAKVAVFIALIRVSLVFQPAGGGSFTLLFGFLFVTTVILGNLMALWQNDVKRLLAYSSIAHAGYLVLGILAHGQIGFSAILFYLLVYSFAVMGAFSITGLVMRLRGGYELKHFDGLSKDHPQIAFMMSLFMVTLAGLPPLSGFFSKLLIFNSAVDAGFANLAIIGVLASILGVYYYIRVMIRMYMNPAPEDISSSKQLPGFFTKVALILSSLLVLILGFFPDTFYYSVSNLMKMFVM